MLSNPIAINAGQNNNLSTALVNRGWQEFTFENKSLNKYSPCGLGCIQVISQSSVSMLGRSIKKKKINFKFSFVLGVEDLKASFILRYHFERQR
jgi:hypothetical protein